MVGNYLIVSESVESDSLRYYYGELSLADRKAILNDFLNGKCLVIVATSSFGMGIDKPNVRFVVHIHPPYSITDYMQQCGRAGRDGQAADCLAFFKGSKSFQMQRRQHKASRKLIKVTDLKTQDDKAIQIEELENYMNLETCRRWLVEHCGSNEDIPTRLDDPEAMKRCCDICRSSVIKLTVDKSYYRLLVKGAIEAKKQVEEAENSLSQIPGAYSFDFFHNSSTNSVVVKENKSKNGDLIDLNDQDKSPSRSAFEWERHDFKNQSVIPNLIKFEECKATTSTFFPSAVDDLNSVVVKENKSKNDDLIDLNVSDNAPSNSAFEYRRDDLQNQPLISDLITC